MIIFDIIGRKKLFEDFWPKEDSIILDAISKLGPLPFKMFHAWPNHFKFFKKDGFWQEDQKLKKSELSRSLTVRLRKCMESESSSNTFSYGDAEFQSLEKLLRSMLQYEPNN